MLRMLTYHLNSLSNPINPELVSITPDFLLVISDCKITIIFHKTKIFPILIGNKLVSNNFVAKVSEVTKQKFFPILIGVRNKLVSNNSVSKVSEATKWS